MVLTSACSTYPVFKCKLVRLLIIADTCLEGGTVDTTARSVILSLSLYPTNIELGYILESENRGNYMLEIFILIHPHTIVDDNMVLWSGVTVRYSDPVDIVDEQNLRLSASLSPRPVSQNVKAFQSVFQTLSFHSKIQYWLEKVCRRECCLQKLLEGLEVVVRQQIL